MSWALLIGLVLGLAVALLALIARRAELARMALRVKEREQGVRAGAVAQLQHPVIDLSRCLGCATCVAVCPESVLELVHGQAMVVRGARCQGISACERECPVGAITITLGDLSRRKDVPALTEGLEAVGLPGVFLAGEVTAHALIKTAVEHGTAVAAEVARRTSVAGPPRDGELDLCVVGAGPAGLACSLEAKRPGLRFVTLDQEEGPGGTVAKYPRRKLVLTQPVDLPLHGRLQRSSYTKEELMALWRSIVERHELPLRGGEAFQGLAPGAEGGFEVRTQAGTYRARHVCLAVGRRGSPRKLGVPGEDLPKVAYGLLDAHSYQGRRILVVGGGDSAVETALALAEQTGNEVTLSYRRERFHRIRGRNEQRLRESLEAQRLQVIHSSRVLAIHPGHVELAVASGPGDVIQRLPNDEVFVMAGGLAPFELLERSGVSFDPALHPQQRAPGEQGTGLAKALAIGLALSLATLVFALWNLDYYALPSSGRPTHPKHHWLRPGRGLGLGLGIGATALIGLNLLYLVRRSQRFKLELGSLRLWMTSHVATGVLALLLAMLHGAMSPRDTVGGHAFWALAALLVTGAVGRYFYAYVPRAANGRELQLSEVKARLSRLSAGWDQGQFSERARSEVEALVGRRQWRASLPGRILALLGVQRDLKRVLRRLERAGRELEVAPDQIRETLVLARRAHRVALMTAHFEDLRALLNSWRYLHRWGAVLLVALVLVHVLSALTYGSLLGGGG